MLKNHLVVLLILFCIKTNAQSFEHDVKVYNEDPIVTDRPGLADTPYLVKKSAVQIESGYNYEFNNDRGSKSKVITYNSTLLRYGLSNNFEFRIISEYIKASEKVFPSDVEMHTKGMNGLSIGTKIFIAEEQGLLPDISFLATLNLPYFGNKNFRPNYVAPAFRFMAQHSLTDKLSLSYNGGMTWDGNNAESTGLYTLGFDYALSKKATVFIENFGFVPEVGDSQHGTNAGLCYLITQNLQFDISAGLGITDISPDGFVNFGFSWKPSYKKHTNARN